MKYIYTLITLLTFICCSSNEQVKPQITTPNQNIHKLEQRITKLENEDLSKNLIQEYKDLNSLYNNGFAVLLTLFGLIFPALIYFIQIVPAQNILKEAKLLQHKLESDFEKSFDEHYKKNIYRIIDESIDSLERLEEQHLPNALINLQNYKTEIFTKNQILRLLFLLKSEDISNEDKEPFASLLTYQKSDEIENYFVKLLIKKPKYDLCLYGIKYFAKNNKTQYIDLIADLVSNGYDIHTIFSTLLKYNKDFLIDLLNNEKFVENINNLELENFCDYVEYNPFFKLHISIFRGTTLWKKYHSIKKENTENS